MDGILSFTLSPKSPWLRFWQLQKRSRTGHTLIRSEGNALNKPACLTLANGVPSEKSHLVHFGNRLVKFNSVS